MFTFGSDPELFLEKNGKIYSAISIIQGDISQRIKIKGHEFYWDNVLAETAIKPSASKQEAVENFRECFTLYAHLVKPYNLRVRASHTMENNQMTDDKCRIAGCSPEMCAYAVKSLAPPKSIIQETNFRTGGGHVHMGQCTGFLVENSPEKHVTVFLMDLLVAVPSLFIDRDPTSLARRTLYGQAGRFRPKDYGLEYRSLSNFWISSPTLVELIFDLTKFIVNFVEDKRYTSIWTIDEKKFYEGEEKSEAFNCKLYNPDKLRDIIDKGQKDKAVGFLNAGLSILTKSLASRVTHAIQNDFQSNSFYSSWNITV